MSFDQQEIFDKSPLGILVVDASERITWCNQRFLDDMGLIEDKVIQQLYPSLPLEAIDKKTQILQSFNDKNTGRQFHHWQEQLESDDKHFAHYFLRRLEETSQQNLKANRPSEKSGWLHLLEYEISRCRRYDSPLSLLKLHLVIISGSPKDDEAIHQSVQQVLTDELRWADMIGHTDHGSYLIILPETPQDALIKLQAKLNIAINREISSINSKISYHLVFGEAYWRKGQDCQELLKTARDNMVVKLEMLMN
jgi:PAS domain-containing protein